MSSPVIPLRKKKHKSPPGDLEARVHALSAADSLNVRMSEPHFKDRMLERGVDMRSVLEVLRTGTSVGSPELDDYGDWRIKMRRKVAGRRVDVVVAVCANHVECITTWA